ncbi:MAG: ABC transporter substrate-binding protein [Geitlerinemataceae cyanobacterium]
MRYLRQLAFGLLSLLACIYIAACSRPQSPVSSLKTANTGADRAETCRTIEHSVGQTEICDRPQEVATLSFHALDLLLSLGQEPGSVTTLLPLETEHVERPDLAIPLLGDRITNRPLALGSFATPLSLETLTRIKPDAIVAEAPIVSEPMIAEIAPAIPLKPRNIAGNWRENLRLSAQMLGDESLADAAIARYEQQIEATRRALADNIAAHPKITVLGGENFARGMLFAVGEESFAGEILTEIGFELVLPPGAMRNMVPVSLELLPDLNEADSILVLGFNFDAARSDAPDNVEERDRFIAEQSDKIRKDWERNPLAQSLPASKAGRVYFQTFYEWSIFNGPIGSEIIFQLLRDTFGAAA